MTKRKFLRKFLQWLGLGLGASVVNSCTPRLVLWNGNGSSEAPFSWRSAHGKLDDVESQLLYARLQAAPHLQKMLPGYLTCGRCEFPVLLVTMHDTPYEWADQRSLKQAFTESVNNGTARYWSTEGKHPSEMPDYFASRSLNALCEDCWRELKTPEKRLPYYMVLVDKWVTDSPNKNFSKEREMVRYGVLNEGRPPASLLERHSCFNEEVRS